MPTEYWTQVLAFETPESTMTQYKLLEDKLREAFKDRCLLTEINLDNIPIIKENNIDSKSELKEKLLNKQEVATKRFSARQSSPRILGDIGLYHKKRMSDSLWQPSKLVSIRKPKMQIRKSSLTSSKKAMISIQ